MNNLKKRTGFFLALTIISVIANCASISRYPKNAPQMDFSQKKVGVTAPHFFFVDTSLYEKDAAGKSKKVMDVPFNKAEESYLDSRGKAALLQSISADFPNSFVLNGVLEGLVAKAGIRLGGKGYFHEYAHSLARGYNGNPDEKIEYYQKEIKRLKGNLATAADAKSKKNIQDSIGRNERMLKHAIDDKNTLQSLARAAKGQADYVCLTKVTMHTKKPAHKAQPADKDATVKYHITLVDTKNEKVAVSVVSDSKRKNDGGEAITREVIAGSKELVNNLSGIVDKEKSASGMDKLKGMVK